MYHCLIQSILHEYSCINEYILNELMKTNKMRDLLIVLPPFTASSTNFIIYEHE